MFSSALFDVFLCVLATLSAADPNTFIKPVKSTGTPVALIWIQGALIPAHLYTPLLKAVQNASSQELWIGQPSFLVDTPEARAAPRSRQLA